MQYQLLFVDKIFIGRNFTLNPCDIPFVSCQLIPGTLSLVCKQIATKMDRITRSRTSTGPQLCGLCLKVHQTTFELSNQPVKSIRETLHKYLELNFIEVRYCWYLYPAIIIVNSIAFPIVDRGKTYWLYMHGLLANNQELWWVLPAHCRRSPTAEHCGSQVRRDTYAYCWRRHLSIHRTNRRHQTNRNGVARDICS